MSFDRNILSVLMDRGRFRALRSAVEPEMLDQHTASMLQWFDVYFKQYPEHEQLDPDTLLTTMQLRTGAGADKMAALRHLCDLLKRPVSKEVQDNVVNMLDDEKLMNVDFQGPKAENDYARRRIAWLNGMRVIETPRIPTAAISDHPLGDAYDLTAAQAKARMIVFFPRKALITVEAMPMSVQVWEDRPNWANVIDSYAMYVVGVRRGDVVAVIRTDE